MSEHKHLDRLGNPLQLNDIVAVSRHNELIIAKVIKLHPRMVTVKDVSKPRSTWYRQLEYRKYPEVMVKIPEVDAMMYILKNG